MLQMTAESSFARKASEHKVRPRKRRKEARPGEIIEAALLEFAQHGFAATKLDDVARRAGVAKGTIYRYFQDKDALFLAVVQSRAQPVFGEISTFIDAFPGTTRQLVELMLEAVHNRLLRSELPILMRIIVTEGINFPALTAFYYEQTVSRGRALITRVMERGIQRGEIRESALTALPVVVMSPVLMAAIWQTTFQSVAPVAPEAFHAAHREMLLNGLFGAAGPEEGGRR